jgi:starch phosphorylase
VDVWVNNPIRPEEACGTSGMKAGLNGALNLSIRDGWWAEASDGENGFDIPSPGPHSDQEVQSVRDHEALLHTLEQRVVPLFFDRGNDGLPEAWLRQVRWAFITLAFRCSADRMVMDYVRQAYLPAALGDVARP